MGLPVASSINHGTPALRVGRKGWLESRKNCGMVRSSGTQWSKAPPDISNILELGGTNLQGEFETSTVTHGSRAGLLIASKNHRELGLCPTEAQKLSKDLVISRLSQVFDIKSLQWSLIETLEDQSFAAAAGRLRLRFRALSLSTRLSSFPLGFFGMTSTNSTPPANLLYPTLLSATCCPRYQLQSTSEMK